MDNLSFVSMALPIHDPFAGRLVWGSAGLAVWMLLAALVGIGLNGLRRANGSTKSIPVQPAREDDWRDAA